MKRFFLGVLCLMHLSVFAGDFEHVYILSFPGSGSHFTLYSLAHLLDTNIENSIPDVKYKYRDAVLFNTFNRFVKNENRPHISRMHTADHYRSMGLDPKMPDDACLILLLRDYKECMMHQWANGFREIAPNIVFKAHNCLLNKEYFDNIRYFKEWEESSRLLIRYEELLENPYEYFETILEFLGEDTAKLDDFIENLQEHKEKCFSFYDTKVGTAQSRGKSKNYHAKKLSKRTIMRVDRFVKRFYSDLWDEYLKEYAAN